MPSPRASEGATPKRRFSATSRPGDIAFVAHDIQAECRAVPKRWQRLIEIERDAPRQVGAEIDVAGDESGPWRGVLLA